MRYRVGTHRSGTQYPRDALFKGRNIQEFSVGDTSTLHLSKNIVENLAFQIGGFSATLCYVAVMTCRPCVILEMDGRGAEYNYYVPATGIAEQHHALTGWYEPLFPASIHGTNPSKAIGRTPARASPLVLCTSLRGWKGYTVKKS